MATGQGLELLLVASQDLERFTWNMCLSHRAQPNTAGKLLLEKGQLRALQKPFVGLVKLGDGG